MLFVHMAGIMAGIRMVHVCLPPTFAMVILMQGVVGAITLEPSPTTIKTSGDNLVISWTDVPSPSNLDWLGIYMPPESAHENYIGYVLLASVDGWETGRGSFAFPAGKLLMWPNSVCVTSTPRIRTCSPEICGPEFEDRLDILHFNNVFYVFST